MSGRADLERRIDRERSKLADMITQVERQEAFIQGLAEALKILPREEGGESSGQGLRPGSDMFRVQEFLHRSGRPSYIAEILRAIGKEDTKLNRASIGGSLARYARRQEIFKRTGPNEFGLISEHAPASKADDLPTYFGDENEPIDPDTRPKVAN